MKCTLKSFVFLIFITAACGKISDPVPGAAEIDHKALDTAEKLYCEPGQNLVEDRTSLNVTFDKITEKSRVFAFSNGRGDCALSSDIEHTWPSEKDPMVFKLTLNADCLPNNSVWVAKVTSLNTEQKYVFQKVGDPSWPVITMIGSNNLAGSYVAGLTGLKILVCQ